MLIFLTITIYAFIITGTDESHFLGGTITWRPLNASATGSPVAIVITQTTSWNYTSVKCNNTAISNGWPVSNVGSLAPVTLQCIYNCGSGSTGYPSNVSVTPICTGFSAPVGTTVGQRSDIVYLASGDDFTAAFMFGAWRNLATVIGGNWSLAVTINTKPRSDNGLYNSAPVATVMSPINIPYNETVAIHIPVADADGDTIRCRWANNTNGINECGGVCPPDSLPPNTIIFPNCTIIVTGLNISDWYAIAIVVEDFINSTSTTSLSSVPVQFLIQVVSPSTCVISPEIVGILDEQSCTPLAINQTFTSKLIAINYCGSNVTIIDIAMLPFAGVIQGNISKLNSTTYSKSFTWTASASQVGYQVMCAMAVDSDFSQSPQYCFKFYVSQNAASGCPGEITSTTSTTSTSMTTKTTTTTSTSTITTAAASTTASISATTNIISTIISTTINNNLTSTSISTALVLTISSTLSETKTTTEKIDLIYWLLIGIVGGLLVLVAITLCCCLCWHYVCPLAARSYSNKSDVTPILSHIERCTSPNCHWRNRFTSNSENNSEVSGFPRSHVPTKKSVRVSVSTIEADHKINVIGNPESVKVSRVSRSEKPRISNIRHELPSNSISSFASQQHNQRRDSVQVIRVSFESSSVISQSSTNDTYLSKFDDTIYLNNYDETKINHLSHTDQNEILPLTLKSKTLTPAHRHIHNVDHIPRTMKKNSSPFAAVTRDIEENNGVYVKHISRKRTT